ncbi:hypothetical protein [Cellulomonas sp. NPDC058312]|uniref:hypothetical protein n=1 Tax=Cellulomonas sp. NPDC058312 TaxID=3346441 RepID=UPI0036E41E9B
MTDTDGTHDGRGPGGTTPEGPSTWNRPTWARLSGDADSPPPVAAAPTTPAPTPPAPTTPAPAAPAPGLAAPMPTRRQIRTGAIPVVPAPPATPAASPAPAASPVPGAPTAPAAAPAASADRPGEEPRAGWTHPNLVGREPGLAAPSSAVPGPGPVPGDDADAGGPGDGTPGLQDEPRRRRWPLVVALVAAVVVVGGGVAGYVLTREDAPGAAAPADVVLPSPTATVEPAARPATTAFATALPATVLQYALASSADDVAWLGQGAIEAYTETYSDGGAGQVTVQAGQWETPEEADAVLAGLAAALPTAPTADADGDPSTATTSATAGAGSTAPAVLSSGEVTVDGTAVGTVTVVDAGDGTGVALWRNGSAVFLVTGPAADIANLYAAYPL